MLYARRYFVAADFCAAFASFGGLSEQLNQIIDVVSLSIASNDHVAISYDRVAKSKLKEKARIRNPDAQKFARILPSGQPEYRTQAIKEIGLMSGSSSQFKAKLTGSGRWQNHQHQNQ